MSAIVITRTPANATTSLPIVITINNVVIAKEVFLEATAAWKLVEMNGEDVFKSNCGEDTVAFSKKPEAFNAICEEILKLDADFKGEVYPPILEDSYEIKILDEKADVITINKNPISKEVFEKNLTEWIIFSRQEFAEWLELEGEDEDAYKFYNMKDEVVIISSKFNDTYLTASETPEAWNNACEAIIKASDSL